jgi:hypothetical protein
LRKGGEAACLVDALRLVGEQHCVPVERDAQLVGLVAKHARKDRRGGVAILERPPNVVRVRREEQVGTERRHVARRRLALRERGARDIEPVVLDRVEHAKPRVGAVARQQDHLDVLLRQAIQPQQLRDERERRPGREQLVLVLDLVAVVAFDAELRVDAVALGEVEQRARADRDDELADEALS